MKIGYALSLLLAAPAVSKAQAEERTAARVTKFATITSRKAAADLAKRGLLERILLFPAQAGGSDVPENVAYVPKAAAEAHARVTEELVRQIEKGAIDTMTVTPDYHGTSFIPVSIVFHATHRRKRGSFKRTIAIW